MSWDRLSLGAALLSVGSLSLEDGESVGGRLCVSQCHRSRGSSAGAVPECRLLAFAGDEGVCHDVGLVGALLNLLLVECSPECFFGGFLLLLILSPQFAIDLVPIGRIVGCI